jgi:phosphoribosylamine--glycine ligase
MRVAVVGGGGREHALAWAMARTADVVVVPGHPGIARSLPCAPSLEAAGPVDLVVVGPEAPLVDGLADRLRAEGVLVVGPGAEGARLEGSKAFMKAVAHRAEVPTAASAAFGAGQEADAEAFLRSLPAPWVVKTDGLAAGKGVLVTDDLEEAVADVRAKLSGEAFGAAGTTVVVEEGMVGPELSVLALCDGRVHPDGVVVLPPARVLTPALRGEVMQRIIAPTIKTLAEEGTPYMGVLYAGLMLTADGPKLVEYNCRFGDPECQVLMMRLESDLGEYLLASAECRLGTLRPPRFSDQRALTVVMAAEGYPGTPRQGGAISGIDRAEAEGAKVFHAGTARNSAGRLVARGGRVLNVTALGADIGEAQRNTYAAVDAIDFPSGFCRRDIGWREMARQAG